MFNSCGRGLFLAAVEALIFNFRLDLHFRLNPSSEIFFNVFAFVVDMNKNKSAGDTEPLNRGENAFYVFDGVFACCQTW